MIAAFEVASVVDRDSDPGRAVSSASGSSSELAGSWSVASRARQMSTKMGGPAGGTSGEEEGTRKGWRLSRDEGEYSMIERRRTQRFT